MTRDKNGWAETVAQLVREALEAGAVVEIDGLGTFRRDAGNEFTFAGKREPKVYIAYVHEDAAVAERLFDAFAARGFDPWLDRRKLLPGQNWPRAIEHAMETTDFVVTCFSCCSLRKKGGFQAEVRFALDCAARVPLDEIYLVPVRLDACEVPAAIRRVVQYVDVFPDFEAGVRQIADTMMAQWRRPKAA